MFTQDLRMLCKGSTTELCAQPQNAQCVSLYCPFSGSKMGYRNPGEDE